MPNRILRDWTNSNRVNQVSANAERFFTRLMMKADDYGRFYADTRLLKANLFPLKLETIREADISRWLSELENTVNEEGEKAGMIVLYEVAGKKYLQIDEFGQRLDKAKAKFPDPPIRNESMSEKKRTESEKKGSGAHDSLEVFDLSYFEKQGHKWEIHEPLKAKLNEFLVYRQKSHNAPIKSYQSVEAILRAFSEKSKSPEESAAMIEYTFEKQAKNIIYEHRKVFSNTSSKTYKKL